MDDASRRRFLKSAGIIGLAGLVIWFEYNLSRCMPQLNQSPWGPNTISPFDNTERFNFTSTVGPIDHINTPVPTPEKANTKPPDKNHGKATSTVLAIQSHPTAADTSSDIPCSGWTLTAEGKQFLVAHEILTGDESRKVILMTYDDNPGINHVGNIARIRDAFRAAGGQATFFFNGLGLTDYGDEIRRLIDEGHEIGFHGWAHENYLQFSHSKIREDIEKCFEAMRQINPTYPVTWIRAPYGCVNDHVRKIMAEFGLQSVRWSVESGGVDENTFNYVVERVKNGSIVLSHMSRYYDVHLSAEITTALADMGYRLVTVSAGISPTDRLPREYLVESCSTLTPQSPGMGEDFG